MSDSGDNAEQMSADREPTGPYAHDPYEQAARHDPIFPSWRYAGLRWLADQLYGDGRSQR